MVRVLIAALALYPGAAAAADLELRLADGAGRRVADAVVTVVPAGGAPKGPIRFPWPTTMVQQNIMFNPHVLIVPVGATVEFPNRDNVRHHIFSFSKPARFDLKLYGQNQTRSYTFTSPGAVALGCNIHDAMSGFIKVVDTPFAAKSGGDGTVRVRGIPAGTATVTVWHPLMRGKDNETSFTATFAGAGVSRTIALRLRPAR